MKAWTILTLVLAASLSAASAPLSSASQDRYTEFKTKFRDAASVKAYEETAKLVRTYQNEAVLYVDALCAQMALNNSDEIEKEIDVLRRSWRDSFKTGFVDKVYEFHSLLALDPPVRKERAALIARFSKAKEKLDANVAGPRDQPTFELLGGEFAGLLEQFERVGDRYQSAHTAAGAAICYDDTHRKNEADLRKACLYWGKAVEHFEAIELNYTYYVQCKQRWEGLVRMGHGPQPEMPAGPGAPADPAVPAVASTPVTCAATFAPVEGIEAFVRPTFFGDEIYQVWPEVFLGAKGTSATFQTEELKRVGPLIVRTDAAKIGVDSDRDGTPEKSFGLTGNFTTVDLEIGAGAEKRRWAFVVKIGTQEDTFQGLKTNLAPDDQQARLMVMNAGSMVATVGTTQVRVLDDNMDGIYGSSPTNYGYPGLTEGSFQPELDCIVVGDSKRARPWSRFQEIGGAWYELASQKGGTELVATAAQVATGTIKVEHKGPPLEWLVLKGTGPLDGCYFDVVDEAKKPVSVPAGLYEVYCGEVSQGKKQQIAKALIMPGPNTTRWTVTAGAETVIKLGAPFRYTFQHEVADEKLIVKGKSVTIEGAANERYDRPWNCAPRPEVSVRKAGAKKGTKPEKMPMVLDLQEQDENMKYKYSMADTWRPLDLELEVKKGEAVEVQLSEKKNRLFGEVESAWQ